MSTQQGASRPVGLFWIALHLCPVLFVAWAVLAR